MRVPAEPWNINIHYDRRLAGLARRGDRVLDVGCGDGFLAARLARAGCEVTAVDVDAGVLDRAQARWVGLPVRWLCADVTDETAEALEPGGFDVVLSNATLHHLPDTGEGLRRLAELTRPGGTVGVVGFATNGPLDWPRSLLGSVAIFVLLRVRGKWEHTAAIAWPPPLTYGEVRRLSGRVLPGRRFRRLWLGRYLLTWPRPRLGACDTVTRSSTPPPG